MRDLSEPICVAVGHCFHHFVLRFVSWIRRVTKIMKPPVMRQTPYIGDQRWIQISHVSLDLQQI